MISERLESMERRFNEIETAMSSPEVLANMEEYKKLAKEHAELRESVGLYRELKKVRSDLENAREMVRNPNERLQLLALFLKLPALATR